METTLFCFLCWTHVFIRITNKDIEVQHWSGHLFDFIWYVIVVYLMAHFGVNLINEIIKASHL